jgi:hypothetical protein
MTTRYIYSADGRVYASKNSNNEPIGDAIKSGIYALESSPHVEETPDQGTTVYKLKVMQITNYVPVEKNILVG